MNKEEARQAKVALVSEIKKYFRENNLKYAVFGLSGGIDSGLIAALLNSAASTELFPIGIMMPCESDRESVELARKILGQYIQVRSLFHDLTPVYHAMASELYKFEAYSKLQQILPMAENDHKRLAQRKTLVLGNIKARLRMITLYHYAGLLGNSCVISTDNYSEMVMGFWTLHGDVGDLSPLQFLLKHEVRAIASSFTSFPREVLQVSPTDGLDVLPGGCDEDQFGCEYDTLDKVITKIHECGLSYNQLDNTGVNKVLDHIANQESGDRVIDEDGPWADSERLLRKMNRAQFKHKVPVCFSREQLGIKPIEHIKGDLG